MTTNSRRRSPATATAVNDPVWRLPLWNPYDSLIDGKVAEINNISGSPFAGSIVAALFLRRFVEKAKAWAHFDIFGWTPVGKTGASRRRRGADGAPAL